LNAVRVTTDRLCLEYLPSYGPVTDTGASTDPASYDYRRAALDALHFPKLVDRLWTSIIGDVRSPMRVAEAQVTLGVVAARYGDIDTAAEHGQAALHGARKSIPTLRMVGREFAAELAKTGAKNDQRLRDYLAELRTATLVGNTTDPL
jgi:hypothetical protein